MWEAVREAAYRADGDPPHIKIHNHPNYRRMQYNIHKRFYEYNDIDNRIHPRFTNPLQVINRKALLRSRRGRSYREVHSVYRDATQQSAEDKLLMVSRMNDPLHDVIGKDGSLGSYIKIKVNPSTIHICIKKNVQEKALRMLADRIIEHAKGGPTRIVLKRTVKGKYIYSEWISTKSLAKMDGKILFERFMKQTKKRTRYVTIILKQKHFGGAIHERIEKGQSLI
jgi:hypothetical protein